MSLLPANDYGLAHTKDKNAIQQHHFGWEGEKMSIAWSATISEIF